MSRGSTKNGMQGALLYLRSREKHLELLKIIQYGMKYTALQDMNQARASYVKQRVNVKQIPQRSLITLG